MSNENTARLGLPLVQAAQAQKHVTVNEALIKLDALANLTLRSVTRLTPPSVIVEGVCYGIPNNPNGAWQGHVGEIAIGSNGGWVFAQPLRGMQGFIEDQGGNAIFDGSHWRGGSLSVTPFGAGLSVGFAEGEVATLVGNLVVSDIFIPSGAMVIGATARVIEPITGDLTGWMLGTFGAEDRFGSGLGLGLNSWARGMLSQPYTYWDLTPLSLTAIGGDFDGGKVRVAVHWLDLQLPDVV